MPDTKTVYRSPKGDLLLYVRTEHRGGEPRPKHLFVTTRNRVVFSMWTEEMPEAELIVDENGRQEANEVKWMLHAAEHDHQIVVDLLKTAVAWLPSERANQLRAMWKKAQP